MHTVKLLTHLVENNQVLVYFIIFFGLIVEGEVTVLSTGILVHLGALPLWSALVVVLSGGFSKTFIGYYIGSVIHDKWSDVKFFKFFEKRVRLMVPKFKEKPFWSLFISKFIMSANTIVILFSGFEKVPFKTYLKAETLATLVWGPGLIALGYLFSFTALQISREIWKFTLIVLSLFILYTIFDKLIGRAYQIFEEFYDTE
jgi:membrane protein DedA with SNARE-associated domain